MPSTDLRFLSAGFREEIGPDRRRTGHTDMVLRCTTEKGTSREVVFDEDDALRMVEQVTHLVNTRRRLEKARIEREAASGVSV